MVVWYPAVGDHDFGGHTVSISAKCREAFPAASQWPPNGEATLLFSWNVILSFVSEFGSVKFPLQHSIHTISGAHIRLLSPFTKEARAWVKGKNEDYCLLGCDASLHMWSQKSPPKSVKHQYDNHLLTVRHLVYLFGIRIFSGSFVRQEPLLRHWQGLSVDHPIS